MLHIIYLSKQSHRLSQSVVAVQVLQTVRKRGRGVCQKRTFAYVGEGGWGDADVRKLKGKTKYEFLQIIDKTVNNLFIIQKSSL